MKIDALIKRINRKLGREEECLCASRSSRSQEELGDFYIVAMWQGKPIATHVDPVTVGIELNVLPGDYVRPAITCYRKTHRKCPHRPCAYGKCRRLFMRAPAPGTETGQRRFCSVECGGKAYMARRYWRVRRAQAAARARRQQRDAA